MFVVPLLLLENRTQKENFELSWFLLLLCPAGLCTTVHVTTSMRENPDIGLGHDTGGTLLILVLDKQLFEVLSPFQVQFTVITLRTPFHLFQNFADMSKSPNHHPNLILAT